MLYFRSLEDRTYMGLDIGSKTLTDDIINAKIKKILNTLAYCYKIELRK